MDSQTKVSTAQLTIQSPLFSCGAVCSGWCRFSSFFTKWKSTTFFSYIAPISKVFVSFYRRHSPVFMWRYTSLSHQIRQGLQVANLVLLSACNDWIYAGGSFHRFPTQSCHLHSHRFLIYCPLYVFSNVSVAWTWSFLSHWFVTHSECLD